MGFFSACLCVLINSQFPRRSECTGQYILARRRQANMRVSHLSPAARNRQENLGRLLHKRRLMPQRKHQISVPPCLRGQRSKVPSSYTKSRPSTQPPQRTRKLESQEAPRLTQQLIQSKKCLRQKTSRARGPTIPHE